MEVHKPQLSFYPTKMLFSALFLFFSGTSAFVINCDYYNNDCYGCVGNKQCKYSAMKDASGNHCVGRLNTLVQGETDTYNCPRSYNIPYSDEYARNRIWPLIGATKTQPNSELHTQCISRSDANMQFINRINVTCALSSKSNSSEFCSADVYVLPSEKQIIIISHGSTGKEQLLNLGLELLFYIPGTMDSKFDHFNGSVLLYPFNAFHAVWQGGLESEIYKAVEAHPGYQIVSTGHSLGGAMAPLIAAQLSHENRIKAGSLKIITFGQPRTGTTEFVKELENAIPDAVRVVNQQDAIAEFPKRHFNKDSMQHMFQEVWYDTSMAQGSVPKLCTMAEDPACRAENSSSNPTAHTTYFNVNIDDWWQSGCKW